MANSLNVSQRIGQYDRKMIWANTNFYNIVLLLISSVLLFSPFGPKILSFGGAYVAEAGILLISCLLIFRPDVFKEIFHTLRSPSMVVVSVLLLCLTLIGFVSHGDIAGDYTDMRALFTFFFFFYFFFFAQTHIEQKLLIFIILSILYIPQSLIYHDIATRNSTDSVKGNLYLFAYISLLYICSRRRWGIGLFFMVLVFTAAAILSFYRSYWIIAAVTILSYSLFYFGGLAKTGKLILIPIILVLTVIVVGGVIQSGVVANYFASSTLRYAQSIGKYTNLTDEVQQGELTGQSDQTHVAYFICIALYPQDFLFPHGLGYKAVINNIHPYLMSYNAISTTNTIDSGYFYFAYHFGLIITVIILLLLINAVIKRVRRAVSKQDRLYVLVSIIVLGIYLTTNADIFVVIGSAAFGGSFLGIVLNPRLVPIENIQSKRVKPMPLSVEASKFNPVI